MQLARDYDDPEDYYFGYVPDFDLWRTEPDYTRYAERCEGIEYYEDYCPYYQTTCKTCDSKKFRSNDGYCMDCLEEACVPNVTSYDHAGLTKATAHRTNKHGPPEKKKLRAEKAIVRTCARNRDRKSARIYF